jgi:hypothetical protein
VCRQYVELDSQIRLFRFVNLKSAVFGIGEVWFNIGNAMLLMLSRKQNVNYWFELECWDEKTRWRGCCAYLLHSWRPVVNISRVRHRKGVACWYCFSLNTVSIQTALPLLVMLLKRQSFPVTCQAGTEERYTSPVPDPGARRGWVISATPRPLYPGERDRVRSTPGWSENNVLSQSKLAQIGDVVHFY